MPSDARKEARTACGPQRLRLAVSRGGESGALPFFTTRDEIGEIPGAGVPWGVASKICVSERTASITNF